jgi:hypothetical protein
MTERSSKFGFENLRAQTPATADLPGAFSTQLPRGIDIGRSIADIPPGAEVRCRNYIIPGVPESSDDNELHYDVPLNRSFDIPNLIRSPSNHNNHTVDLPPMFSPERTVMSRNPSEQLAIVFDHFDQELARLGHRWLSHAPAIRITAMIHDFRAFMQIMLDDVELVPIFTRSAESTLLVHDTYVRLITIAGVLREGMEARWANLADLESAYAYANATLDAFTPFVGLADRAMRRICLEGETLEAALRWLSTELDDEAAERLRSAEQFVARAYKAKNPGTN